MQETMAAHIVLLNIVNALVVAKDSRREACGPGSRAPTRRRAAQDQDLLHRAIAISQLAAVDEREPA